MKKIIIMLMVFAPMSLFAQKFGHVDSQAIMQGMPEFISARGEVEAQTKKYEDELQSMQQELQRKSEEYEKNASTMNDTKRQETETELQQMYQKIQPITTKLLNAIKNVGKNGSYVYIMDVAAGIPYISESLSKDVTAEVKAELQKLK